MFWGESLNLAVKLAENTNVPSAYIIPGYVKLFWNAKLSYLNLFIIMLGFL